MNQLQTVASMDLEVENNVVTLSCGEATEANGDEDLRASYALVEVLTWSFLYAPNNAVLIGFAGAEYVEPESHIPGTYLGKPYSETPLNFLDGFYLYGDCPGWFFCEGNPEFSQEDFKQLVSLAAIAVFVNYRGPKTLDGVVADLEGVSQTGFAIKLLEHCEALYLVGHDGLGFHLLTKDDRAGVMKYLSEPC
jgi:hypothetical protein